MCSVQDGGGDLQPKAKSYLNVGKKCMKCERAAVTTARTKDPFCKECFNAYFVHRFRATFGKVRLFTTGERVLLAFSGGVSSRVLLGLAEEGLKLSAYKKLRFEPTVVVIDEGAVLGEAWSERCCLLSQCLAIATATGFQTIYTQIEQVFGECVVCSVNQLLRTGSPDSTSIVDCSSTDVCSKLVGEGEGEGEGGEEVSGDVKGKGSEEGGDEDKVTGNCDIVGSGGRQEEVSNTAGGGRSGKMESDGVIESGEGRDGGAPCEEVLYQALLGRKREEGLEQQIRALFGSCSSVTAQENMLVSLRHQLLVGVACKQGYSKVLMGDNATRLAVRLLGNVAQGRGRTLPLDTGFIDDRTADVAIIRPLREFPANEVAMYASFNGLHSLSIPHLTTLAPEQASIERLTESFVVGLQVDFPSTVSTVFRTGDKLTVGGDDKSKSQLCALCQVPTGPAADPSVFTHLSLADRRDPHLWPRLCYGCQLTVTDMKCDSSTLPPFVHQSSNVDTQ